MRLTLNLPEGLLEAAMAAAGQRSKTATIVAALQAYERLARQERLRALRGEAALLRGGGGRAAEPAP